MIASCWIVNSFNESVGHSLDAFGLQPRTLIGIIGIFASPFLHKNEQHLINNTLPFVILSIILCFLEPEKFVKTIKIVWFDGSTEWNN